MRPMANLSPAQIDEALCDPRLLGAALGDPTSWQTWRAVLRAAFGLELNRDEARAFGSVAGSRKPPSQRVRELWAIVGRRAGKCEWRRRLQSIRPVSSSTLVGWRARSRPCSRGFAGSGEGCVRLRQGIPESSPVLRQEIVGSNALRDPACATAS